MFDLAFDTMSSFQALMLFMGALFCLGLGSLLVGDFVHWRQKARRTKGKIVSIREKQGSNSNFYYPVAEYQNEQGETCRVTSDVGRGDLNEAQIGKKVTVLYFPGTDKGARILGHGIVFAILGFILLGMGGFLIYWAASMLEAGWPVLIAAMIIGVTLWGQLKHSAVSKIKWKQLKDARKELMSGLKDSRNEGRELSLDEIKQKKTDLAQQQAKWSWLILVIELVFFGVGYYIGYGVWYLETYGLSAGGKVVGMESSTDSEGSTTYSPIVEYDTADGHHVRFTSSL